MNNYLIINPKDNVMVALKDLKKGDKVNGIVLQGDVARGHKIALIKIKAGDNVFKYGEAIGSAIVDILAGSHVHTHNVKTNLGDVIEYKYKKELNPLVASNKKRVVNVYKRDNGNVGIRNEIYVIPTVGCIVGTLRVIVDKFKTLVKTNVKFLDDIQVISHTYGCSQMGDDHVNTKETLQNIASHPNAGGVLVVGLGCENNQMKEFVKFDYDKKRTRFLIMQEVKDEIEAGVNLLLELYENMKNDKREKMPISCLNVGLECGGSDGLSGITANPLLGKLSDYLVDQGGTTVLTEVPEMFGAEKNLMKRASSKEVFEKVVEMVNGFKNYYKCHNQVIYDNPSPGNKNGGITTLEDKSLGCTEKSGTRVVIDVLKHTEKLKLKGLNLLGAPGNDLVATTALGMCGCQMVLFTTGRGTPFGGFIPTMKISTNSDLYERKPNWIDFNAGMLADGVAMDESLEKLLDLVVEVANGKQVNNELNHFKEIAIFKDGVIL